MQDNQTMDFMMGEPGALSPTDVVRQSLRDVQNNLRSYCMAGLGFLVAVLLWVVGMVLVCGLTASPMFVSENEIVLIASASVTGLGYLVFLVLIGFWVTPQFLASLLRDLAAHNRQGSLLTFNSVWKHNKDNRSQIAGVNLLVQLAVGLGLILCIVPGVLIALATVYALPLVALYEMPPVQALKASVQEFKANLTWHLSFLCMSVLLVTLVSLVPIIGALIAQPLLLRLYLGAVENAFGHVPLR